MSTVRRSKRSPQNLTQSNQLGTLDVYNMHGGALKENNKLISDRIMQVSIVNSVLLVAFFSASATAYFEFMKFALPAIGIAYSGSFIFALRAGASQVVRLYDLLCRLEQEPEFEDLRKRRARPFSDIADLHPGRAHMWKLGTRLAQVFPLIFVAIWIISLYATLYFE